MNVDIGSIIDRRYQIVSFLGDGGMGTVFEAREIGLDRIIAIKILHASLISDPEAQARFKREGKLLSAISHPNVLRIYRIGVTERGVPYIAMEFLQGESLRSILNEKEILAPEDCLQTGISIAAAMQAVHNAGIVHRDLKPNNIMFAEIDNERRVKIVDFGIARILPEHGDVSQRLTQTGALIGSLYYMSPEQCRGAAADHRSDIYALGCLLYEALTGVVPIQADNPIGLMHKHITETPDPVPAAIAGKPVPLGLGRVLFKAMSKDATMRYQSMTEFESDLRTVAMGLGFDDTVSTRRTPLARRYSGAVAAFVLICAGALAYWHFGPLPHNEKTSTPTATTVQLPRRLIGLQDICRHYSTPETRVGYYQTWLRQHQDVSLDCAEARYNLAKLLASVGGSRSEIESQQRQAQEIYATIISSTPNQYTAEEKLLIMRRIGSLYGNRGDFKHALAFYKDALADYSDKVSNKCRAIALQELCEQIYVNHMYDLAEPWFEQYRKCLDLIANSEEPEIHSFRKLTLAAELSYCQWRSGSEKKALQSFKEALSLTESASSFAGEWTAMLRETAELEHQLESMKTVLARLEERFKHAGATIPAWLRPCQGDVYAGLGDYEHAQQCYKELVDSSPSGYGFETLGRLLSKGDGIITAPKCKEAVLEQIATSTRSKLPAGRIAEELLLMDAKLPQDSKFRPIVMCCLLDYICETRREELRDLTDRSLIALRRLLDLQCSQLMKEKYLKLEKRLSQEPKMTPVRFKVKAAILFAEHFAREQKFTEAHSTIEKSLHSIEHRTEKRGLRALLLTQDARIYRLQKDFAKAHEMLNKALAICDEQPSLLNNDGTRWTVAVEFTKLSKMEKREDRVKSWKEVQAGLTKPVDE